MGVTAERHLYAREGEKTCVRPNPPFQPLRALPRYELAESALRARAGGVGVTAGTPVCPYARVLGGKGAA